MTAPDRWTLSRALNVDVILNDGTKDTYLTPLVRSVTWSGDNQQATRKLDVAFTNTIDGKKRHFDIAKGDEIRFIENGAELFRGVIFADSIDIRGSASLTAYDENIYLTKNKDSRKLVGKTASSFIKSVCKDFGIPVGDVEDTGYVIPSLILRDKTIYEMFIIALTVTHKHNGRKFSLASKGGKLVLFERKKQVTRWLLEKGVNILDASYSQNIEDMRTKVKVVGTVKGAKTEISAEAKDSKLIAKFGIMQHLESASGDVTASSIQQLAKQLLSQLGTIKDEARLRGLGVSEVISGTAVYVYEPMTGIQGGYYVSSDSHTWESGAHTMDVTLSATDDIPRMEYEPPNEEKPSKAKTTGKRKAKEPAIVGLVLGAKGVGK